MDEIEVIKEITETHFFQGRSKISELVCLKLNWKQPNGWLKDRACREVLIELHNRQLIELPPPLHSRKSNKYVSENTIQDEELLKHYLPSNETEFISKELVLEFVRTKQSNLIWNAVIRKFHYLGHKVAVGRSIKYLVWNNSKLVSALSFTSASWSVEARDKILSALGYSKTEIRERVINNGRFLVLPDVKIYNLASQVLSLATSSIANDWEDFYAVRPLIAETFVQPSRYKGICYRAANWIEIGETKGYAKRGARFIDSQEHKKVLIFGLDRQTRRQLRSSLKEK